MVLMWAFLVCLRHMSLVFPLWEKRTGSFFFFFSLLFAMTFHLIEACCSGSSQSPPGWMKTQPMLSHVPPQSEWGRQLGNPLCNSFTACDGGDTEGVDKTRTGQIPSMMSTQ